MAKGLRKYNVYTVHTGHGTKNSVNEMNVTLCGFAFTLGLWYVVNERHVYTVFSISRCLWVVIVVDRTSNAECYPLEGIKYFLWTGLYLSAVCTVYI